MKNKITRRQVLKTVAGLGTAAMAGLQLPLPRASRGAGEVVCFPSEAAVKGFDFKSSIVIPGRGQERNAELLAKALGTSGVTPRVIPDDRLGPAEKESFHQILVGTARDNSVIGSIEAGLLEGLNTARDRLVPGVGLLGVAYNPHLGHSTDALLVTGRDQSGVNLSAVTLAEVLERKKTSAALVSPPLPSPFTVKLAHVPGITAPAFWAGTEAGFGPEEYSYHNAKMERLHILGAPRTIEALVTGHAHIGIIGGNNALFSARLKGLPLKIIGVSKFFLYPDYPLAGIIALPEAGIGTVKDLKGKRVAINAFGGGMNFLLDEALVKAGLSPKDVQPVEVPFPGMPGALKGKAVDAAFPISTFAYLANVQFGANVILWDTDIRQKGFVAAIVTSNDLLKTRKELLDAYFVSLLKGSRWTISHLKQAEASVMKNVKGVDERFISVMRPFDAVGADGTIPGDKDLFMDSLREDLLWSKKLGYIPGDVDDEKLLKEIADPEPLRTAMARVGIKEPLLWGPFKMTEPGPWERLRSNHPRLW